MSSYQTLKEDRDRLARLWKIAREAMMQYLATFENSDERCTDRDLIIIKAVFETGEIMNGK